MIRATDGVILTTKHYSNCMGNVRLIFHPTRVADVSCPLKLAYRNNYSNKSNAYRKVIEVKYVQKRGQ
jgi:hypothetical protein